MAISADIHIVGGGIGGLATALACAQRGAKVTVFERAHAIKDVGAGIQISPNGMRVLDALGVGAAVRSGAVLGSAVSLRRAETGGEVARLKLDQTPPYAFVHRADLISVLVSAAEKAGVTIDLSSDVAEIHENGVCLSDGSDMTAKFIVDASGVHSQFRQHLNQSEHTFFTGQVAWRAVIPNHTNRTSDVRVYMAPGAHIVSYPLRDAQFMNLVAVQERDAWAPESWTEEDDPANLQSAFAGACEDVTEMLGHVTAVHLWGLFRHDVATVWTTKNAAMIGDAAHPTLPFLAQGANMALEDAWCVAACIDADPVDGLQNYQEIRHARVTKAIRTANGNAKRYHLPYGPVRFAAHAGLKTVSTLAPGLMTAPFKWLYDYDITKEVI